MAAIQLIGDANDGGGILTHTLESNVFINGKLVALHGSLGTSHSGCPEEPIHCYPNWSTSSTENTVFINNLPITLTGDVDTCGHIRVGGSSNVFIGN